MHHQNNKQTNNGETSINTAPPARLIAVFASGAGTNAARIIEHFNNSSIARVALIVCNKPGADVLQVALKNNVPVLLIERKRFFEEDGYANEFQQRAIDFVVLAGFLWKIPQTLIDIYRNRIINIHPALLPLYGGRGMYGSKVHEAVLNSAEKESGITIHYVDEHYDNGDVILQVKCPVYSNDTAESLAQRIHELEYTHYPKVVEDLVGKM